MLSLQTNVSIPQFLNHPFKRILLIIGEIDENFLQDLKREIEKEKIPAHYVDLRETVELENFYAKLQFDKISEKIIIFCNPSLLHPTLDPSIYFAPIKGQRIQRHLLSKLVLPLSKVKENALKQVSAGVEQTNSAAPSILWHQKLMTQDAVMMQMLADNVIADEKFKDYLFQVVYSSRHDDEKRTAAANAITALNASGVKLHHRNFSEVQISSANLSGTVLVGSNFSKADLSNVNFDSANLSDVNFTQTNLSGVYFAEQPIWKMNYPIYDGCYVSPDGRKLAVGTGTLQIYDLTSRHLLQDFENIGYDAGGLNTRFAWSNASQYLAVWSTKEIFILDILSREKIQSFKAPQNYRLYDGFYSLTIAWDSDDKHIASVDDKIIRIWNVVTGAELVYLEGHNDEIIGITWGGRSQYLASISLDKTIRIWDVAGRKALQCLQTTAPLHCLASSEYHDYLAVAEGKNICIYDTNSTAQVCLLQGHTNQVMCLVWDPSGKRLASGSYDGSIRVWDIGSKKQVQRLEGHILIHGLSWERDGRHLISAGGIGDEVIRVWNVSEVDEILNPSEGHSAHVLSLSMDSQGKYLASGSTDSTVCIWDINGKRLQCLKEHANAVVCVAWDKESKRLASASANTVLIWEVATYKVIQRLTSVCDISKISWSADGSYLAAAPKWQKNKKNEIQIWALSNGEEVIRYPVISRSSLFEPDNTCVVWSPDGRYLASGTDADNIVRIWDFSAKEEKFTLELEFGGIRCFAWTQNSDVLAVGGGKDNSVIVSLWNIHTAEKISASYGEGHPADSIVWCFSDKFLIVANGKNILLADASLSKQLKQLYFFDKNDFTWVHTIASATDNSQHYLAIGFGKDIHLIILKCGVEPSIDTLWIVRGPARLNLCNADITDTLGLNDTQLNLFQEHKAIGIPLMPLHKMVMQGDEKGVSILADNGVDVNRKYKNGKTALHLAVMENNLPIVIILLSRGAKKEAKDDSSQTALMCAVRLGFKEIVKYLIEVANVDCMIEDNNGDTALDFAVCEGYLEIVQYIVSKGGDIHHKTNAGDTPLVKAAEEEHLDVITWLLSQGARLEDDNIDGMTALLRAARLGKTKSVRLLYSKGASLHHKNRYGFTALQRAAANNHFETVIYLLSVGANIEVEKDPLYTPFHRAAAYESQNVPILYNSLETKLLHQADQLGNTPLHYAAGFGTMDALVWLLENTPINSDINRQGDRGYTPLHLAIFCNQPYERAQFLIKHGSNVNKLDNKNRSPLFYAVDYGNLDVVKLLVSTGSDIQQCDRDGETPLSLAKKLGYKKIEEFLEEIAEKPGVASSLKNLSELPRLTQENKIEDLIADDAKGSITANTLNLFKRKKGKEKEFEYIVADSPEDLKQILIEVWEEASKDHLFALEGHYILCQFVDQRALLRMDASNKPPNFTYCDLSGRPATNAIKEIIADFLWNYCGEKQRFMKELEQENSGSEYYKLARIAVANDDLQNAVYYYEKIVAQDPGDQNAQNNLACYYFTRGILESNAVFFTKARDRFQRALALDNTNPVDYANFLFFMEDYSETIRLLSRMVNPDENLVALVSYGAIDKCTLPKELQNEVDAQNRIDISAVIFSYYLLIASYKKTNNTEIALQLIQKFYKKVEETPEALNYSMLGYSCKALGLIEKAKDCFSCAYKLNDKYLLAKQNRDECYLLQIVSESHDIASLKL